MPMGEGTKETKGKETKEETERAKVGLALLKVVARQVCRRLRRAIDEDELVSMGTPALAELLREHDPARSALAPWLHQRLTWALLDGVRSATRGAVTARKARAIAALEWACAEHAAETAGKVEPTEEAQQKDLQALLAQKTAALAAVVTLANADPKAASPARTPEDQAMIAEALAALAAAVEQLPDREQLLVRRYYYEDEPIHALAGELGISRSRASHLLGGALERLGKALRVYA